MYKNVHLSTSYSGCFKSGHELECFRFPALLDDVFVRAGQTDGISHVVRLSKEEHLTCIDPPMLPFKEAGTLNLYVRLVLLSKKGDETR